MSIPKHHAEWLSLIEISGPFLSMPVLMDAFPQGLDAGDAAVAQELRAAYEEWLDNQGGLQPDPAIHHAWVRYVLQNVLGMPDEVLAEGQAIPGGLKATIAEHHEVLRPDMVVQEPDGGRPRLLLQTYPPGQALENAIPGRNWKASPATRMMELLHSTEVRLGLLTNGEHWLLVQAKRGETTGYAGWYAGLWVEERLTLRAFHTLLGAQRFFGVPDEEVLETLLDRSAADQHEVTDQLGLQVRHAVEILIQAVDRADQDRGRALLDGVDEARLYEAALTVMMRLVFLLAAEERGLLLLDDPTYDQNYAISTLRGQLQELADRHGEEVLERRYDAWCRLLATFRAVYGGVQHEDLRLPAYGGSLFDPDRFPFLEGREAGTHWREQPADPLPVNNRVVLHLLEALQKLQVSAPGGLKTARTLSFRALDIEQIGHVYEGLLDHQAARASEPVVGLQGTKNKEPEISLSQLENLLQKGEKGLLSFLKDQTGRTTGALRNGLQAEVDAFRAQRLRAACGNNDDLYRRVLPFAGLIRDDDYDVPVIIPAGSVYVTEGATRRQTGTHYTPRSLTEPIVQHTLETLVYEGPAEGKPRDEWRLRSPKAILKLKVCDMAMGSGAFLVQACRYLSERLVEAWDNLQSPSLPVSSLPVSTTRQQDAGAPIPSLQITPDGQPATGDPAETIIPQSDEERLVLARRLVVDRCLYGVDKNHLAVEMAKLSLWLITLDKNRPFTFVDHSLRHGDSLIAADDDMFLRWAHSLRESSMPLFDEEMRQLVDEAREKRRQLQAFEVRDVRDAQRKAQLLAGAEAATERIKLGCDLLVGARMLPELTQTEQEALLANGLIDFTAGEPFSDRVARRAVKVAREQPAFHWPFEFPEVFAEGGFSAFVGNPPFIGGRRIRETHGDAYRAALYTLFPRSSGNADYCSFFFLRGYEAMSDKRSALGLLATNTIAQGDTRSTGLKRILDDGGRIFRATSDQQWPGNATVTISIVHLAKGELLPPFNLDGTQVQYISSFLDRLPDLGEPKDLKANEGRSYIGSLINGMGFTLEPEQAKALIDKRARYKHVLFPYLGGQDLNSHPGHLPARWVINFHDWSLDRASEHDDLIAIVRQEVKPHRDKVRRKAYRKYWWQFAERQASLYEAIEPLRRVLIIARVTKHMAFTFVPKGWIYNEKTVVITEDDGFHFAVLQSNFHEAWIRKHSSTLETRINYSPTKCFITFPFPERSINNLRSALEHLGNEYFEYRQRLMRERTEGLTSIYNRFNNPNETSNNIALLRQLHCEVDNAVAAAYGWDDVDLGHNFHETDEGIRFTISDRARREVLMRLLKLNHERYEEEVRQGLHEGKKSGKKTARKGGKRKGNDAQLSLF